MAGQDFSINIRLTVQQILDCCTPDTSLDLTIDSVKVYDGDPLTGTLKKTVGPYSWSPTGASQNYDLTISDISCSGLTNGDLVTVVWEITINTITNTGGCTQVGSNYSNGSTLTVSQTTTSFPC